MQVQPVGAKFHRHDLSRPQRGKQVQNLRYQRESLMKLDAGSFKDHDGDSPLRRILLKAEISITSQ